MGMTVYLFDKWRRVRKIIPWDDVSQLIHDEGNFTLEAEVPAALMVMPGECLGFRCVDGIFRLFEVTGANYDDDRNVIEIKGMDAAVMDLKGDIIEDVQQIDVTLKTAIRTLAPEWEIVGEEPDRVENSRAYYATAWAMVQTLSGLYEWRIIPHYEFADGKIGKKVMELSPMAPVFRGRILQGKKNASKIYVSNTGKPITRLYGLGPVQGTTDLQTNMTFADAEWSKAKGDPADKPKGQTWVEDAAVEATEPTYAATVSITDAEDENDLLQKTWEKLQTLTAITVKAEANAADMEMLPGHSHEQIRLNDLAAVKLRIDITVDAKIVGIKRNYKYIGLTKITLGDKKDTIQAQVATLIGDATHTFERLTIYQNRFEEDEELIQLNAAVIQENAEHIQRNAESIIDYAEMISTIGGVVDEQGNLLVTVRQDIDAHTGTLSTLAKSIETQAETIATQGEYISTIGGIVDDQGDLLVTVRQDIDAHTGTLSTLAKSIETQAETIRVQAELIEYKADRVDLDAYVKANELEADVLYIASSGAMGNLIANTLTARASLQAVNAEISEKLYALAFETYALTVGGQLYDGMTKYLLAGTNPGVQKESVDIWYKDSDGTDKYVRVLTDVSLRGISVAEVNYLGYATE